MRVISKKALRDFWKSHGEAKEPLSRWHKIISKSRYEDFSAIKKTFPSADYVEGFVVFNIGGNKFRLVVVVHYKSQRVYVREVMTHEEYNHWNPK